MSVTLQWNQSEQTAVILTITAPWTWDEFEALSPDIADMFAAVPYDIDLMIDMRHAGHIPDTVFAQLRDAYAEGTLNLRQYIFVGASPAFIERLSVIDRYLSALGGRLDYRCVDTLEEAQRISYWKHLTREYAL